MRNIFVKDNVITSQPDCKDNGKIVSHIRVAIDSRTPMRNRADAEDGAQREARLAIMDP